MKRVFILFVLIAGCAKGPSRVDPVLPVVNVKSCQELYEEFKGDAAAAKAKYASVTVEFEVRADRIDEADGAYYIVQSAEKPGKDGKPTAIGENAISIQFKTKKDVAIVDVGKPYKARGRFESFDGQKLQLTDGVVYNLVIPPSTERPAGGGVGRAPTK